MTDSLAKLAELLAGVTEADVAALDAEIARLVALRNLLAAREPGKAPAPSPVPEGEPGLSTAPPRSRPVPAGYEPRSKYMRPILAALADGPLTAPEIGARVGKEPGYWSEALKLCPWFEPVPSESPPSKANPTVCRLTEAGRDALSAATSVATAEPGA